MAETGGHLARLRRADSQAKTARVRAALDAIAAAGEPPGISPLAQRARVSAGSSTITQSYAPKSPARPRRWPTSMPGGRRQHSGGHRLAAGRP
jgi:hypothetical protein